MMVKGYTSDGACGSGDCRPGLYQKLNATNRQIEF
jgi:hypothetical protein